MRFREIITEGRDAALYHGASFLGAISILKADEILASSEHDRSVLTVTSRPTNKADERPIHGVSLTRSKRVAFDFGAVVFAIDQRKLAQTHRLLPMDYWAADNPRAAKPTLRGPHQKLGDRYEAEEFCIGPIKPLARFLTAIYMTTRGRSSLEHQYQKVPEQIAPLLNHPLLRMVR